MCEKNVGGDIDHLRDYLIVITFEVNQQPHAGLHTSPFELLFNCVPRPPAGNERTPLPNEISDINANRGEPFAGLTDYTNPLLVIFTTTRTRIIGQVFRRVFYRHIIVEQAHQANKK